MIGAATGSSSRSGPRAPGPTLRPLINDAGQPASGDLTLDGGQGHRRSQEPRRPDSPATQTEVNLLTVERVRNASLEDADVSPIDLRYGTRPACPRAVPGRGPDEAGPTLLRRCMGPGPPPTARAWNSVQDGRRPPSPDRASTSSGVDRPLCHEPTRDESHDRFRILWNILIAPRDMLIRSDQDDPRTEVLLTEVRVHLDGGHGNPSCGGGQKRELLAKLVVNGLTVDHKMRQSISRGGARPILQSRWRGLRVT